MFHHDVLDRNQELNVTCTRRPQHRRITCILFLRSEVSILIILRNRISITEMSRFSMDVQVL